MFKLTHFKHLPAAKPRDTNVWSDCVYGREIFGPSIKLIRALDPQSNPPVPMQRNIMAKKIQQLLKNSILYVHCIYKFQLHINM